MTAKNHWQKVHGQIDATSVSWYASHLQQSLHYVQQAAPDRAAAIIDVGGEEFTLLDDLFADGYTNLTVLDISAAALDAARSRLGESGQRVILRPPMAWMASYQRQPAMCGMTARYFTSW